MLEFECLFTVHVILLKKNFLNHYSTSGQWGSGGTKSQTKRMFVATRGCIGAVSVVLGLNLCLADEGTVGLE